MSAVARIVGVCGAGAMGSGIAQVAAQSGDEVVVLDTSDAALSAGRARIASAMAGLAKRGKLSPEEADAVAARVRWTTDAADFAPASLVIEAIVEDERVKGGLFAKLEEVLADDAVLATNTSSLSVTRLASALRRPERFVGMHFFNPAPVMKLVEVVGGAATAPAVVADAAATARRWGKVAVPVADVAGFIVNRVARPFYAEALLAWDEGTSPQLIDHLFRGAGFRMGPLELTDLIGQDVNFAVARSVFEAYEGRTRFAPQPAQGRLVEAGTLGRKTGRGVYAYASGTDDTRDLPAAERPAGASIGEGEEALLGLVDSLAGSGQIFAEVRGSLVGLSRGRSAAREAADAGRDVAVFDWTDGRDAPLAFAASSDAAAAVATGLARSVGRGAFRIADRPGLVVLRTLAQLANAAADAAADDVAREEGIDSAMRFGANYPFGPFAWADRFGRARVVELLANLADETGDAIYAPSAYLGCTS